MSLYDINGARRGTAVNIAGGDQEFAPPCRAIYIGGGSGGLVCRLAGDTDDTTFAGLITGQVYPFQIVEIRQTGTTISSSVALF